MKCLKGFSIIELMIVIIILSLFSIIALFSYQDLSLDKKIHLLATQLSSANDTNYSERKKNSRKGFSIHNCTDGLKLLSLPPSYIIRALEVKNHQTIDCDLKGPSQTAASFKITGID